jgi:hypothetical protein
MRLCGGGQTCSRPNVEWPYPTKESGIPPKGEKAMEENLEFVCVCRADVRNKALIRSAEGLEIPASFA